ncbi:MAG TPA: hypothetical protein VJ325_05175, partial [Thiobacillus sp.]|nr:hypothetical protein [Thiobacillus sp.]
TATKAMTDQLTTIATGIKAIQDGETARNKAVADLETFVKEQFQLQSRASQSAETVVPKTDPQAAFLAMKAADPNATVPNANATPGEALASMFLKAVPPTGQ